MPLVQGRENQIHVPKMTRELAGAYLRAFGLDREGECLELKRREAEKRESGRNVRDVLKEAGRNSRLPGGTRHTSN